MQEKYRNYFFFFIILSLIFTNIPRALQCDFLFGTMALKLSAYPIFFGMLIALCKKKQNASLDIYCFWGVKYIVVYLMVTILSLIYGLSTYPYYELILNGPTRQINKLNTLYLLLQEHNIPISFEGLLTLWMLIRPIKGLIIETIMTFGTALLIFEWFKNDKKTMLKILMKSVYVSVICILLYSVLDCGYLLNNFYATTLLKILNPFIHEIKNNGTWWPPLLQPGQLRSLFTEPSHYGIYSSFALPWLWYGTFFYKKKVCTYSILLFFTFCLYLTKARTAVMLLSGEIVLLVLFTIAFRKDMWKHTFAIIFCTLCSFFLATSFINYSSVLNSQTNVTVKSYIDDNMESLASPDKRSNRARYSVMEANFKIGLSHPLLGVGYSLRQAYTKDYLSEEGLHNNEIKGWLMDQERLGLIKSGFPPLGDYFVRFAETGIIGVSLFLVFPGYLFYLLYHRIFQEEKNELCRLTYIFFSISLIGVMTSGIGDTLNVTYCYWTLLGIGYSLCFRGLKRNEYNNEK